MFRLPLSVCIVLVFAALMPNAQGQEDPRRVNPQRVERRLNQLEQRVSELDQETDALRSEFAMRLGHIESIRSELSSDITNLTSELLGEDSPAARGAAAQAIVLDNPRQTEPTPTNWKNRGFLILMMSISIVSLAFIMKIFFTRWGSMEDAVDLIEQTSGYKVPEGFAEAMLEPDDGDAKGVKAESTPPVD